MTYTEEFVGKRIGIVGFGKEGQATAQFLRSQGLRAHVFDEKPESDFASESVSPYAAVGFTFSFGHDLADFGELDVLFRTPGVRLATPGIARARAAGCTITSQTVCFLEHCPATVIGVTGTKGKGTTTTLIYELLQAAKREGLPEARQHVRGAVYITGNIGKDDPFALLPLLTPDDIVVFELSSFQLQDVTRSPHIGVCLMVTSEHLDHHADLAEYHRAKSAICAFQTERDFAVYAQDYPASVRIGTAGRGTGYAFSRAGTVARGAYCEQDTVHIQGVDGVQGVVNTAGRQLRGAHNLENIMAASIVGVLCGLPLPFIERVVKAYKGLEHRLEYVGTFDEVSFYNDSISTTPESAIAALEAFAEPPLMILGGSEKFADFSELAARIAARENMRGVLLIGQTAPRIRAALDEAGVAPEQIMEGAQNMRDVFALLAQRAQPGDVVLLSPACASFGMFQNYADRGRQFADAARKFQRQA